MNKKEYIKPKSKFIMVACASVIAESLGPGTEENGTTEAKYLDWEEDED